MNSQPKDRKSIAIGSDHAGWPLKEELIQFLSSRSYKLEDFSRMDDQPVDYPDVGLAVAGKVSEGAVERAILICGTGLGMTISANKLPGVRACLCHESYSARMSREHNDSNILVLGGRIIGPELAKEIVSVWLTTEFSGGRHSRRLAKIAEFEKSSGSGKST